MRFAMVSLALFVLTGCANLVSYELQPNLRQQLTWREASSASAVGSGDFFCAQVDTTGLMRPPFGLEPDEVLLGYESYETAQDQRPRCRTDVNVDNHAWLSFDLTEFTSGLAPTRQGAGAELTSFTITAVPVDQPDNANCDGGSLLSSVRMFGQWVLPRTLDNLTELPVRAGQYRLDGNTYTIRQAENHENFPIRYTRFDSERRIALVFDGDVLDLNRGPIPVFSFTFLGAENPSWTDDHKCLTKLEDIRLNLIFRE